jgi:hypothetical protein
MSYDNCDLQDDSSYDDENCCELCGNYYKQGLIKLNDGDYIKYRCADCLNDEDTIVIALEVAIGHKNMCHKCGLDTSNKPYSTNKTFIIGGKVLHWDCLEDIVREAKLPNILDIPDLQEESGDMFYRGTQKLSLKCCKHAVTVPCVCVYSYKCKVCTNDLQVCHGSHS